MYRFHFQITTKAECPWRRGRSSEPSVHRPTPLSPRCPRPRLLWTSCNKCKSNQPALFFLTLLSIGQRSFDKMNKAKGFAKQLLSKTIIPLFLWLLFAAEAELTHGKLNQLNFNYTLQAIQHCLHVSIICRHVNHNLFSISFVFSTQHAFHFYRWINCHNTLLWSHILSKLGAGSKSWWKLPGFTPPPQGVSESAIFFSWRMLTRKLLFLLAWLEEASTRKIKTVGIWE